MLAASPPLRAYERLADAEGTDEGGAEAAALLVGDRVSVAFDRVSYAVDDGKGGRKVLLQSVGGSVRPGDCTAILGSSGSGKTTLLDILAGVIPDGDGLTGDVLFNGRPSTAVQRRAQCAYVLQDDRLLPNLTVRQTFWYAAALRVGRQLSNHELHERVEAVIGELGLRKVADNSIGGYFSRGISGGERRRVSIGVQLLANPSVLLLDEPTTGLDAFNANALVQTLSQLAQHRQKTILFTIHQPRSDIFALLGRVMLLSSGRCVYHGAASALVGHLAACGYPCGRFVNPLDHAIDTVIVDRRTEATEAATTKRLDALVAAYEASAEYTALADELAAQRKAADATAAALASPRRVGAIGRVRRWLYTFNTVLARQTVNLGRDPIALALRCLQQIAFALVLSAFVLRLDNNQSSVQNRNGLLYQSLLCTSFIGMLNVLALFPEHRDLFYRERRQKLYSAATMLMAYVIHILPPTLFSVLAFSSILYNAVGLYPAADRFWIYTGVVFASYFIGEFVGVFFLSLFYSTNVANSASSLYLSVASLVSSGSFRAYERMPDFVQWLSYTMYYKYSSEVLMVNEFEGLPLRCDPDEACRFPSGDAYLAVFYPDAIEDWALNSALTAGFVVFFGVFAWLTLALHEPTLR